MLSIPQGLRSTLLCGPRGASLWGEETANTHVQKRINTDCSGLRRAVEKYPGRGVRGGLQGGAGLLYIERSEEDLGGGRVCWDLNDRKGEQACEDNLWSEGVVAPKYKPSPGGGSLR